MNHLNRPIVAEDYVCGTTVDSNNNSDNEESSVTKDPDSISKALI
jgi:hypothetical protein